MLYLIQIIDFLGRLFLFFYLDDDVTALNSMHTFLSVLIEGGTPLSF